MNLNVPEARIRGLPRGKKRKVNPNEILCDRKKPMRRRLHEARGAGTHSYISDERVNVLFEGVLATKQTTGTAQKSTGLLLRRKVLPMSSIT